MNFRVTVGFVRFLELLLLLQSRLLSMTGVGAKREEVGLDSQATHRGRF